MRSVFTSAALAALVLACGVGRGAEPPPPARGAFEALRDTKLKVSLDVQNVPLDDVLRILSKQFNLSIITAKNVTTAVSARFQDVSLQEALESLVTINGFAYRVKGNLIEVYLPRAGESVTDRPRFETFKLKYANAEQFKALLKPFLSKDLGKVEADIPRNILIIFDTPDVMESIAKVIDKVDHPEPQVTIGAEIIEAAIGVNEKLGIDWQTRIALTGASRPVTFPFPNGATGCAFAPKNDEDSDEEGGFSSGSAFPNATPSDFTFGTLDATGLKIVLDILQKDTGTNLIANPEITTLNNREAKITIGDTVPVPIYTTNLETGVSAVTGFEEVETGTILTVTPQVNNDGQSVTMRVVPEISEILGFKGQFDERPITASRRAETTVRLGNGETLVIGGLVSEKTDLVVNKLPVLGDIPVLGWLFRSKAYERSKSSLYIFITPRIMSAPPVYTARAKKAGRRLTRNGLKEPDTGADDIRNPGASPFE